MSVSTNLLIIQTVDIDGVTVGGIIVLGVVWEKIRPIIIIKTDKGVKFFYGISHSDERKNMKPLTQSGVTGITVEKDTCYGFCNTPSEIIKEIGTISIEKAQEIILETSAKKLEKKEKRIKNISNN